MQQKMTITIDKEVYDALYRVVGKGNIAILNDLLTQSDLKALHSNKPVLQMISDCYISKFLENLARPHVLQEDLASAYQAMAADTERELAALERSNELIGSTGHFKEE